MACKRSAVQSRLAPPITPSQDILENPKKVEKTLYERRDISFEDQKIQAVELVRLKRDLPVPRRMARV